MEKYLVNIGIENQVEMKYGNQIIPEIKDLIRDYLFNNPDKFNLYINDKIDVNKMLRTVSRELAKVPEINHAIILNKIIELVEVDYGA